MFADDGKAHVLETYSAFVIAYNAILGYFKTRPITIVRKTNFDRFVKINLATLLHFSEAVMLL